MALSFVGMFFVFPYNNAILFFLEYMLVPCILLFFMLLTYPRHSVLTQISLVLCGIIATSYIVFSIFYAPRIIKWVYDSPKTSNFKMRIKDYYEHARSMSNTHEMIHYVELYNKYFPNDPWDFPGLNQQLDIRTKDSSDVVRSLHLIRYFNRNKKNLTEIHKISESFTPLTYFNLGKLDLIQKTADYANDSQFYAANLLLTHYIKKYGQDSRSKKLQALIQQRIENTQTSYTEQSRIQLQTQIQYLYNVLSENTVNEKTINRYYQSIALGHNYPHNEQLQWLQKAYFELLTQEIFFADEAREALLKSTKKMPLMFVENGDSHRTMWIAKDVSYVNNVAYLENIELIRIQGKTTRAENTHSRASLTNTGTILWHIKSPYAKLSNNKLMLYSLEPGSIASPNTPKPVSWYKNLVEAPWHLNTSVQAKEIMFLHAPMDEIFFKTQSIINYLISIPLWKKHSLNAPLLYKNIIETLLNILFFIAALYIFTKMKLLYSKNEDTPSFTRVYFLDICLGFAYSISKAYSAFFLHTALGNEYYRTYVLNTPATIIISLIGIGAFVMLLNMIRTIFISFGKSQKKKLMNNRPRT